MIGKCCSTLFWYGTPLESQGVLHFAIPSGSISITAEHNVIRRKLIDPSPVRLRSPRFPCAKIQFTQRNAGDEDLLGLCELIFDNSLAFEQGNDDVGIQQESTTTWYQPARNPARSLRASNTRHPEITNLPSSRPTPRSVS